MSLHPLPEEFAIVERTDAVGKSNRKVFHLDSSHQSVVGSEVPSCSGDISATAIRDKSPSNQLGNCFLKCEFSNEAIENSNK